MTKMATPVEPKPSEENTDITSRTDAYSAIEGVPVIFEAPAPMLAHVLLEAATAKCREHSDTIIRLTAEVERIKNDPAFVEYKRLKEEVERLRAALSLLVRAKREKDEFGKTQVYLEMMQGAWEQAIAALKEPRT